MFDPRRRVSPEKLAGLCFVLALHGAALYGLWRYRLLPLPAEGPPVFVDLLEAPKKPPPAPPKPVKAEVAKPVKLKLAPERPPEAPPAPQLVAEAPIVAPAEPVAPPPPVPPAPIAAVPTQAAASLPVIKDLSLACSDQPPPKYPTLARLRGVQGTVVVRVELNERGDVTKAEVASSSGSSLLDTAALAAVRQWHCRSLRGGGQVATHPFKFRLEEER